MPLKLVNYLMLAFEIFLCFSGIFLGFHIAFGMGLGDLVPFALLYLLLTAHVFYFIKVLFFKWHFTIIQTSILLILLVLFCLKATIWRSSEFPWNGQIFYPSNKTEVVILSR